MVAECRLFNFVFVFNFTQFFCQDSSVIQRLCFLIQLQRVKETALWEIEILTTFLQADSSTFQNSMVVSTNITVCVSTCDLVEFWENMWEVLLTR